MDLKSFSNTDDYAGYRDESILAEKEVQEDAKKVDEQGVKDAIGRYSKLSNDELMVELMKQVAMQKDKGNSSSMKQTIERIKPFLNNEQRQRLEILVKQMGI